MEDFGRVIEHKYLHRHGHSLHSDCPNMFLTKPKEYLGRAP